MSANAETACLPAFPDGPEKLRSLKTTEFSVVSYFLTKQGTTQGAEGAQMTPEQFAAFIRSELEKWARLVKSANIRLE